MPHHSGLNEEGETIIYLVFIVDSRIVLCLLTHVYVSIGNPGTELTSPAVTLLLSFVLAAVNWDTGQLHYQASFNWDNEGLFSDAPRLIFEATHPPIRKEKCIWLMVVCREERLPRKLYRFRLCDCDFQDALYKTACKIYAFKVISVIVITLLHQSINSSFLDTKPIWILARENQVEMKSNNTSVTDIFMLINIMNSK